MKRLYALTLLLLVIFAVSGCIFSDDKKSESGSGSIVGTWLHQDDEYGHKLVFYVNAVCDGYNYESWDNNWYSNGYDGSYAISGNILTITWDCGYDYLNHHLLDVKNYAFTIQGNTLTLESEDGKTVYTRTE